MFALFIEEAICVQFLRIRDSARESSVMGNEKMFKVTASQLPFPLQIPFFSWVGVVPFASLIAGLSLGELLSVI